ncbi:hypothetical protein [Streptomyces barkulensis]|uniref:hypothetical protein n=1 Tax=Streptomyces barkulensis TaxID=1257026 RepID=UPI000C6CCE73|nr:hypothetical protein [Streptomyces barkulensis]
MGAPGRHDQAYSAQGLEVVGGCAAWSTVDTPRISLYPDTSQTVTIRLESPCSPVVWSFTVAAGDALRVAGGL